VHPDDLHFAWGGPVGTGRLRTCPEDFRVEEQLAFEPGEGGEHAWLLVRKRGMNTDDVAWALARHAGVRRGAVSFSGMKDRHAETVQWFSVQLPGREDPDWSAPADAQWAVVRAVRHGRKLRPGTHRRNRFAIRVRELNADPDSLEARLRAVRAGGFPNYFGPQRFGHKGENLRKARRQLVDGERDAGRARGIHLSAARAWLFNRILDCRVADGTWCSPRPGDALMLAGTHSVFEFRGDEPDIAERIQQLDLDVTGPLWGIGRQPVSDEMAARERTWLSEEAALAQALEAIGMAARRRSLRAAAADLAWSRSGDTLDLAFSLPSGAFATSLVRELLATDTGVPSGGPRGQ